MNELIECPNHGGNFDCTPFCKLCGGNQELKKEELNPNIRSIFIEGRLWFDKVNGNTYHAVRINVNGKTIGQVGITYGYESAYLDTALKFLKSFGLLPGETKSFWELRRKIDVYFTSYYTAKRDLYKEESLEDKYPKLLFIEELKKGI